MRFRILDGPPGQVLRGIPLFLVSGHPFVHALSGPNLIDVNGWYSFDFPGGDVTWVVLKDPGFVSRGWCFSMKDRFQTDPVDLILPTNETIGGRVVDYLGQPLACAEIQMFFGENSLPAKLPFGTVLHGGPPVSVRTDSNGNWVFDRAPSDSPAVFIFIKHGEDAPMQVGLAERIPNNNSQLMRADFDQLLLRKLVVGYVPPYEVEGEVLDLLNRPIVGVSVIVTVPSQSNGSGPISTRMDGCRFRITHRFARNPFHEGYPGSDHLTLVFRAEGYRDQALSVPPGGDFNRLVVRLGRNPPGLIPQSGGIPNAAKAFLDGSNPSTPAVRPGRGGTNDNLAVAAAPSMFTIPIRCKLVDSKTGSPLPRVDVFPFQTSATHFGFSGSYFISGEDGTLEGSFESHGLWWLVAVTPGYRVYQTEVFVPPNLPPELLLQLEPLARVHCRLLDPKGNPVAGALVGMNPHQHVKAPWCSNTAIQVLTREDGSFDYVVAERPDLQRPLQNPIRPDGKQYPRPAAKPTTFHVEIGGRRLHFLEEDLLKQGEIRVPATGDLCGHVEGDTSVAGWYVQIHGTSADFASDPIPPCPLGPGGSFRFRGLNVGTYNLLLSRDEDGMHAADLCANVRATVLADQEVAVVFRFARQDIRGAIVTGRLEILPPIGQGNWMEAFLDSFGISPTVIAEYTQYFPPKTRIRTASVERDGSFCLQGMIAGPFELNIPPVVRPPTLADPVTECRQFPFLETAPSPFYVPTAPLGQPGSRVDLGRLIRHRTAWRGLPSPVFNLPSPFGEICSSDFLGRTLVVHVCTPDAHLLDVPQITALVDSVESCENTWFLLVWSKAGPDSESPKLPDSLANRIEHVAWSCGFFDRPAPPPVEEWTCDWTNFETLFGLACLPATMVIGPDGVFGGLVDDHELRGMLKSMNRSASSKAME